MSSHPKALLFDLGGVLVDFDGINPLIRLSQGRLDAEGARRFWLESRWVKAFETGGCNRDEFARGVVSDAGFDITPEEFLLQFASWEKGCFPGSRELLQSLRGKITLACLSNNNELHWEILHDRFDLASRFDHVFLSFAIGFVKPDPRIYLHALTSLALPPGDVVFFDDNPECVRGAEAVGIRALQVKGPSDIRAVLSDLGLPIEG